LNSSQSKTNAEIASELNLSPKTVSNNISNVLLKVQATDRAKLMLMALEAEMGQTNHHHSSGATALFRWHDTHWAQCESGKNDRAAYKTGSGVNSYASRRCPLRFLAIGGIVSGPGKRTMKADQPAAATPRVSLYLLGALRVERDEQPIRLPTRS
jgi:hypothetical protein